jgi:hypothetical protein
MTDFSKKLGFVVVVAITVVGPKVVAQENTSKYDCQSFGSGVPEALGDGLLISTDQYTCHVVSGPMSGGVMTGTTMWKWNGPEAILVSGNGIARKDGAAWVFVQAEGKIVVTMSGGKATGFGASGTGRIVAASGSAASSSGKVTTWTVAPNGPRQFTVDEKMN